jgi:hypothetical protein
VVFKWEKRNLEAGLEGLNDLPRSSQPRKLSTQKTPVDFVVQQRERLPDESSQTFSGFDKAHRGGPKGTAAEKQSPKIGLRIGRVKQSSG